MVCDVGWMATAGQTLPGGRVTVSPFVKRVASAVIAVPAFVWVVVWAPAWLFTAVVVAASAAASLELTRMLEHAGRPVYKWLGVIGAAAVTAGFAAPSATAAVLGLAIGLILSAPVWSGAPPATEPAANTLLSVLYIGWMLGYGILLHDLPHGAALVLFLAGVTWVGESVAYLVGSTLGRHKLAPVISPGKTVEGAMAQVFASVVAGAGLGLWLLPSCGVAPGLAAGAVIGVVGQVGDLAESVIKRSVGTKDTGALIPGHGGVLDRIDSLLFNLPAFYFFTMLTGCAQ